MRPLVSRRTVLQSGALGLAAVLAGCAGGGEENTPDVSTVTDAVDYGDWFADTSNFAGTYDYTGRDEVVVTVGAEGNGGNYAFGPAAIAVTTGTTVTWQWTGEDGPHSVTALDGTFDSGTQEGEDVTFARDFAATGTRQYYCIPHRSVGMKGAVDVRPE